MRAIRVLLLVLASSLVIPIAANGDVEWLIEEVDNSGHVAGFTDIVLDSNGYPHISYPDPVNYQLKHAYFDGDQWHIEVILLDIIEHTSIDLDSNDYPHICYYQSAAGKLAYVYYDGSSWQSELVDDGNVGSYCSIALDEYDHPHISYHVGPGSELRYAHHDGTDWNFRTFGGGDVGYWTSIALDNSNYPHISHYKSDGYDTRYTYQDASGWQTLTAPEPYTNSINTSTSIAVAADNYIYISYRKAPIIPTNYDLICAYYNGTGWGYWTVDSGGLQAGGIGASAIAVDNLSASTRVHIGYHAQDSPLTGGLKYAVYYGTWQDEVVDSNNNLGDDNVSIAVDNNNKPHVHMSYFVESTGYLRHAMRNYIPVATSLIISPPFPTEDDGLTCSYAYGDENGDPDNSFIAWYVDDVHAPAYDGELSIPATATSCGQNWYFKVNPFDGISYGSEQTSSTVTIGLPPIVSTNSATNVSTYSATLNGILDDLGTASSVAVSFEWGLTTSYGNTTTPQSMTGTGSFSFGISSLLSGTTYHFRTKAVGDCTEYGDDMPFTTSTIPPTVTTNSAYNVGTYSATMKGTLDDLGTASSVAVSFEWGLTTSYGNNTPSHSMTGAGSTSYSIGSLEPGTTYHFRIKAVGDGTDYGNDMPFTTSTFPNGIPTLSQWGMVIFFILLTGSALLVIRRRTKLGSN